MEHYKIIKLVTGDQLVCTTDQAYIDLSKDQCLTIADPVILSVMRMPRNGSLVESYVLLPWVSFAQDEIYEIPTRQIITMSNIKDSLKKNYLEYVKERTSAEQKTEEVSTVEEIMEQLAEELGDDIEQDENRSSASDRRTRRNSKLYH